MGCFALMGACATLWPTVSAAQTPETSGAETPETSGAETPEISAAQTAETSAAQTPEESAARKLEESAEQTVEESEAKSAERPAAATGEKKRELISLERPGPREFVRDQAHLVNEHDTQQIKQIADRLLTDKATPIIVVTINTMAEHAPFDLPIESFAQLLFDQWNIGVAKLNGQDWNTGILLLVSKGDRKARIELGGGWRRDHDRQAQQIMDEIIVPHFKKGDFSGGILAGVEALDKMARGLKLPSQGAGGHLGAGESGPPSPWAIVALVAVAGVAIFTIVSLIRSGGHGWGWLLWAGVFSLLGVILYQLMSNSFRGGGGGSGGDYSGGSFGGGFSGGGGASGSW
jgi:uncharacterized protein